MKRFKIYFSALVIIVSIVFFMSGCSQHKHIYGEWTVIDNPACTIDGFKERKCIFCSKLEQATIPNFAGHADADSDAWCDACGEQVYRVEVELKLENNAGATADDFILMSNEHGGIIAVTLGENSMIRGDYSVYAPTSEDYPFAGDIVSNRLTFISYGDLDSLTSFYYCDIPARETFGGIPKKVVIDIADTTQTGLVVINTYETVDGVHFSENLSYQCHLFYGKRNDRNDLQAGNDPDNYTKITSEFHTRPSYGYNYSVVKFAYPDGEIIGTTPDIELLLTEKITYIDLFLLKTKAE